MNTSPDPTAELQALVDRVRRHQEALGLGDKDFVARYSAHLRSVRTWRYRLLDKSKWHELKIEQSLRLLRGLVATLDGGTPVDSIFEDLPVFQAFYARYRLLLGRQNDRRALVMLAPEGTGKTICARHTVARSPDECVYVRCWPTWRNRELTILQGLAEAIGVPRTHSANQQLSAVLDRLRAEPRTLFLDESHDGGVALLKLVKTIIDATSCKVVILAFPTLWKGLVTASSDAYAEARQLQRRTLRPVFDDYAQGTTVGDIETYLRRSLSLGDHAADVARQLHPLALQHGNLSFVADVVEACDFLAGEGQEEITGQRVLQEAHNLVGRRK